jgi:LuxR family transcriptional regulator, glucitol operon activator
MATPLPNLTLYALLSAFEEDMRNLVEKELGSSGLTADQILGEADFGKTVERAEADPDGPVDKDQITALLPYLDFNGAWMALNRHRSEMPKEVAQGLKNLSLNFGPLPSIRNRVAHARPLEYSDLPTVTAAVDKALEDSPALWPELAQTKERLANDPSFILRIEPPKRDDQVANNLPDPDFEETGFLGRGEMATKVKSLCLTGGHHLRRWRRRQDLARPEDRLRAPRRSARPVRLDRLDDLEDDHALGQRHRRDRGRDLGLARVDG